MNVFTYIIKNVVESVGYFKFVWFIGFIGILNLAFRSPEVLLSKAASAGEVAFGVTSATINTFVSVSKEALFSVNDFIHSIFFGVSSKVTEVFKFIPPAGKTVHLNSFLDYLSYPFQQISKSYSLFVEWYPTKISLHPLLTSIQKSNTIETVFSKIYKLLFSELYTKTENVVPYLKGIDLYVPKWVATQFSAALYEINVQLNDLAEVGSIIDILVPLTAAFALLLLIASPIEAIFSAISEFSQIGWESLLKKIYPDRKIKSKKNRNGDPNHQSAVNKLLAYLNLFNILRGVYARVIFSMLVVRNVTLVYKYSLLRDQINRGFESAARQLLLEQKIEIISTNTPQSLDHVLKLLIEKNNRVGYFSFFFAEAPILEMLYGFVLTIGISWVAIRFAFSLQSWGNEVGAVLSAYLNKIKDTLQPVVTMADKCVGENLPINAHSQTPETLNPLVTEVLTEQLLHQPELESTGTQTPEIDLQPPSPGNNPTEGIESIRLPNEGTPPVTSSGAPERRSMFDMIKESLVTKIKANNQTPSTGDDNEKMELFYADPAEPHRGHWKPAPEPSSSITADKPSSSSIPDKPSSSSIPDKPSSSSIPDKPSSSSFLPFFSKKTHTPDTDLEDVLAPSPEHFG